jgi:hypothetical protein
VNWAYVYLGDVFNALSVIIQSSLSFIFIKFARKLFSKTTLQCVVILFGTISLNSLEVALHSRKIGFVYLFRYM